MIPRSREFRRLVALCRKLGRDLHLAQAGGGNASMKLDAGRLAIKASGARLRELTATRGWTVMRALGAGKGGERAYAEALRRSSLIAGRRPSMEAGIHAGIAHRFVIHLHSTAAIVLSALGRAEALARARRIARGRWSTLFLPVGAPGRELASKIRAQGGAPGPVTLRLLESHGVVWSGDDLGAVARAIAAFEDGLRPAFGLNALPPLHEAGTRACRRRAAPRRPLEREVCACRWPPFDYGLRPLFPDFAVFFGGADISRVSTRSAVIRARSPRALADKTELLFSHWAVCAALSRLSRRPRALPAPLVRRIRALETERARLAQMDALRRGRA